MTPAQAALALRPVSRETEERLEAFVAMLLKWNGAINLIGKATVETVWSRHIVDSLQLLDLTDAAEGHWADLGSGGGLPGLVLAIAARDERPGLRFTLVESDARKAAFLATASRSLAPLVRVLAQRVEAAPPLQADVLSARALAPLPALLEMSARHLSPQGLALLPKGANWRAEVTAALESWRLSHEIHPSLTDPAAVVLKIRGISRV